MKFHDAHVHCIMYNVYCTMYNVQCMFIFALCIRNECTSVHCTLYICTVLLFQVRTSGRKLEFYM